MQQTQHQYVGALTLDEYKRRLRQFPRLSEKARAFTKAVLVDGKAPAQMQEKMGVSRILSSAWCLKVWRADPAKDTPSGAGYEGALSLDDFKHRVAQFPRLSEKARAFTKAVLVDGRPLAQVQEKMGVSRQLGSAWCLKVFRAPPAGWLKEVVTLPAEQMARVREMEAREKSRAAGAPKRKKRG